MPRNIFKLRELYSFRSTLLLNLKMQSTIKQAKGIFVVFINDGRIRHLRNPENLLNWTLKSAEQFIVAEKLRTEIYYQSTTEPEPATQPSAN